MLQYKTKLETSEKVQKSRNTGSPLRGWGAGSKEPTRRYSFFIIMGYSNQQTKLHIGPYYLGSKGLQQAYNKLKQKHNGGGSL